MAENIRTTVLQSVESLLHSVKMINLSIDSHLHVTCNYEWLTRHFRNLKKCYLPSYWLGSWPELFHFHPCLLNGQLYILKKSENFFSLIAVELVTYLICVFFFIFFLLKESSECWSGRSLQMMSSMENILPQMLFQMVVESISKKYIFPIQKLF